MTNKYNVGDKVALKPLPIKTKWFAINRPMEKYFGKIVTISGVHKYVSPDFYYYHIQEDDSQCVYEEDWFEDTKYSWEDL